MVQGSIVHLEVVQEWWVWEGYLVEDFDSGTVYLRYNDPMDKLDFDDTCSFPSLKPNTDVFRPPLRSRRQRGWYQVKSTPSPAPCTSTRSPMTGEDIPPELFEYIIEAIAPGHRYRTLSASEKRLLGRCALVCRFWASKCQPMLFGHLALRARTDVLSLADFDKDPSYGFLQRYDTQINITIQRLVETNWIHLMSLLEHKRPFDTRLEGPLPKGWKSMRSIHQALPRTLPQSFSKDIGRLVLVDIRFQRLHDLMHLVSELPHVETIRLERVSWGAMPTSFPRQRNMQAVPASISGRERRPWSSLTMIQCSPASEWVRAALYLCSGVSQSQMGFFSRDDLERMVVLSKVLEAAKVTGPASGSKDIACHAQFVPMQDGKDMKLRAYMRCGGGRILKHNAVLSVQHPYMPYATRTQVSLEFKVCTNSSWESGGLSHPADVIALTIPKPEGVWKSFDWFKVDNALASFPRLQTIVLGFDSMEEMRKFKERVVKDDGIPSTRRRLRYAVRDGRFGQWLRVLPQAEVLQTVRKMHLVDVYN